MTQQWHHAVSPCLILKSPQSSHRSRSEHVYELTGVQSVTDVLRSDSCCCEQFSVSTSRRSESNSHSLWTHLIWRLQSLQLCSAHISTSTHSLTQWPQFETLIINSQDVYLPTNSTVCTWNQAQAKVPSTDPWRAQRDTKDIINKSKKMLWASFLLQLLSFIFLLKPSDRSMSRNWTWRFWPSPQSTS